MNRRACTELSIPSPTTFNDPAVSQTLRADVYFPTFFPTGGTFDVNPADSVSMNDMIRYTLATASLSDASDIISNETLERTSELSEDMGSIVSSKPTAPGRIYHISNGVIMLGCWIEDINSSICK